MKEVLTQSTVFGTVLMMIGLAAPALWVLDLIGMVVLTDEIPHLTVYVWPLFFGGVGWLFIKGQGKTIGEAAMWWFKRGGKDE